MFNLKEIKPFFKNRIELDDSKFENKDNMNLLYNFLNHAEQVHYNVYFVMFQDNSVIEKVFTIFKIKYKNYFKNNHVLYINDQSSFNISKNRYILFFESKNNIAANKSHDTIAGNITIENYKYYCDYTKSNESSAVYDYATQYGKNTSEKNIQQFLEAKLIMDIVNSKNYIIKDETING